jgi:UMF1 family MFS transporter
VTTVTQSARLGVSPVFFLFLIGLILLAYVHKNGDFEK